MRSVISSANIVYRALLTWKSFGSGGIRTHASEETGALNQRLRPLGHATMHKSVAPVLHNPHITIRTMVVLYTRLKNKAKKKKHRTCQDSNLESSDP